MTNQEMMDRLELRELVDIFANLADEYKKMEGEWYIKKRRSKFLISEKHEWNV